MAPDGWVNLAQRYQKLNQKNDFLPKLNQVIPWEEFRPVLEQVDDKPRKSNAGRKPFDRVLMFKLLMLQHLHNLSDERLEYQVYDRFSFMQLLGLSGTNAVPDATMLWLFRHPLTEQQKQHNRAKSKIRAKVEHVFGAWVNEMGGKLIRSIGLERARTQLGLKNLAYNLKRFVYLETQAVQLSSAKRTKLRCS